MEVQKATPTMEMYLHSVVKKKHIICAGGRPTISSGMIWVVLVIFLRLFASKKEQLYCFCYLVAAGVRFSEVHRRLNAAFEENVLSFSRLLKAHKHLCEGIW